MIGTMERRSDGQLAAAAAGGDEQAFEALVERHFNSVYLTAYARLGDREAAEDLAQEVFLRAHLHLGQMEDRERFSHWVCRVARNLAEDWRRRRQTASRLLPMVPMEKGVEELPGPESENVRARLARQQEENAVRKAILALPPDQREVVMLHYAEGLSDREIAERLGMHYSTVYYHRNRALEQFRGRIGEWLGSESPGLLPPRKSAARAAAIVAAAAAMSAQSRAALAKASASTLPSQAGGAAAASVSAQAPAAQAPALLTSLKAPAFMGVLAVIKGKLAVVGGVALALALAGGGVYYSAAGPGGWAVPKCEVVSAAPGTQPEANSILGHFTVPKQSAQEAILGVNDLIPARLVVDTSLPEGKWDIKIHSYFGRESGLRNVVNPILEKTFGVSIRQEKRRMEALVLRRAAGAALKIQPGSGGGKLRMTEGRVEGINVGLGILAKRIEYTLKKPVVDETGLTGIYTYTFRWHPGKLQTIPDQMRKQLGLELVTEERDVDVTVVGKGAAR